MTNCQNCGREIEGLPFNCRRCHGTFCTYCRLPELHKCTGLRKGNIFRKLHGSSKERFSAIQFKNHEDAEAAYDVLNSNNVQAKLRDIDVVVNKNDLDETMDILRSHERNKGGLSPEHYRPLTTRHTSGSKHTKRKSENTEYNPRQLGKNHYEISLDKLPESMTTFIKYVFYAMLFSNIIFPFILLTAHSNMQPVIGNPKPVYFYDISPSCGNYAQNIVSSLDYMSSETGVKFISLPNPFALLIGGISYDCTGALTNYGAVGEAESGFAGVGGFIFAWNDVRMLSLSRTTIVHETLHVMGFAHNGDLNSIMHPSASANRIEPDIIYFIRRMYSANPLAYLNIIPLNLLYIMLLLSGVFGWIFSALRSLYYQIFYRIR